MGETETIGSAAPDTLTGRCLGEFVVREPIGEGGFATVYRAEQPALAREVVVKILHARHRGNQEAVDRFLREARLASRLDHPYAAHIYGFGAEPDGLLWLAMELVRGTPLSELLRTGGPMSPARLAPLLEKICEVIQTAHDLGIVHRDLKPANVMVLVRAGRLLPKLLDFGIAKGWGGEGRPPPHEPSIPTASPGDLRTAPDGVDGLAEELTAPAGDGFDPLAKTVPGEVAAGETTERQSGRAPGGGASADLSSGSHEVTREGSTLGTPGYMAPEQWSGLAHAGPQADLYALGVIAFEALAGQRPFQGANLAEVRAAHLGQPIPRLPAGLPPALDDVLQRALAKRPEERFATPLELAAAVRQAAGLATTSSELPRLDEALRVQALATAPRPIALGVRAVDQARNPHELREAIRQVARVVTRYLGLLALCARSSGGRGGDPEPEAVARTIRALRRRSLADDEWLALARDVCRPFRALPERHPLPELVALLHPGPAPAGSPAPPESFEQRLTRLLGLDESGATEAHLRARLTRLVPELAALLRELAFTASYRLVLRRGAGHQEWMGATRASRSAPPTGPRPLEEGWLYLVDPDRVPVVALHPLVQVASPAPGAPEELFLLEGAGRHGARLVAFPDGLERHDDAVWDFLRRAFGDEPGEHAPTAEAERAPYLGLRAFTAADAKLFFGREREADAVRNRLRVTPLVAVVGASGAGKSSFVHAGVIPGLPVTWRAITVRPGRAPLAALAAALERAGLGAPELAGDLEREPARLGARLRAAAHAAGETLVLVVDQLEELFTLTSDPRERALFAEALAGAARLPDDPVRVVLTLRDDFLMRAELLGPLRPYLAQSVHLLGVPTAEDLARIFLEPLRRAGYELDDPALSREMAEAVAEQPGALALLSFTAATLWERRDRHFRQLTRKAYAALGGVGGALAQHAEETLAGMPAGDHPLVREAFRHLVTAEGTRATLTRAELLDVLGGGARSQAVVERLIEARLLIAQEASGADRVEIVHEALLDAWPRVADWRREEAEGARLRDQLRAAARQWEERGRTRGLLWRDDALVDLERWRARHPGGVTATEAAFARASALDATRGRRRRRLAVATALVGLTAASAVLLQRNQVARRRLVELYQEQGRQELLNGSALRAAVYLEQALDAGSRDPSLRFLLARALEPIALQRATLAGHRRWIEAGTWSADGRLVATGSADGSAWVWDAATGRPRARLVGHGDGVNDVAFSPAGDLVVTASLDGTARLWGIDGRAIATLTHRASVRRARFSPDGRWIATAGADGDAALWSGTTGALARRLVGHTAPLRDVAFDPTGTRLATASEDMTARVFSVAGTAPPLRLAGHGGPIWSVGFSPDGERVVTTSEDKTARIWRAASGAPLVTLHGHHDLVRAAAFSADGRRLLTTSLDRTAMLWDSASGALRFALEGHRGWVRSPSFSPDGRALITSSYDGTARLWDAEDGHLLRVLEGHSDAVMAAVFSPDGGEVLTVSHDRTARIWDVRAVLRLRALRHGVRVNGVAFSPDGRLLASASDDGTAALWDVAGQRRLRTLAGHRGPVLWTAFRPDGGALLTSGEDRTARIWDTRTGRCLRILSGHGAPIWGGAFSPDGRTVVTASDDKTARIWDAATGATRVTLAGHGAPVNAAGFSPDGRLVLTASGDGTARLWEAATGRPGRRLTVDAGDVFFGAFDPSGRRVVTSTQLGAAQLWDVATGERGVALIGHLNGVPTAAFSPDGTRLLTAGEDGSGRVWDAATGRQLWSVQLPTELRAGVISPDGESIALATGDGRIVVRPLGVARQPVAEIDARLRCQVPFRWVDDALLPAAVDLTACKAVSPLTAITP